MPEPLREFTRFIWWCRMAPSGRRPKTKPDDLVCESACTGCQKLHSPSPFIIITQPKSWYSFYRPTEGGRLSRSSWLVTYRVWFTRPQTVTHPGTNRVWRSATKYVDRGERVTTKPNRLIMLMFHLKFCIDGGHAAVQENCHQGLANLTFDVVRCV